MIESYGEYNQPQEFFHPGIEQPPMDIVPGGSAIRHELPDTTAPIVAREGRGHGRDRGYEVPDEPRPSTPEPSSAGGDVVAAAPDVVEVQEGTAEPSAHTEIVKVRERAPLEVDTGYVPTADGVRPRDPVTLNVLEPGEIPPSVLADPGLRKGHEYLQEHGDKIRLRFLGVHHEGPEDLDPERAGFDLSEEARRVAEAGGILYVEKIGKPETLQRIRDSYKRSAGMPPEKAELARYLIQGMLSESADPFEDTIVERLLSTGVVAEPIDFVPNGQRMPDRILTALDDVQRGAFEEAIANPGSIEAFAMHRWAKFGFDTNRDGYLICRLGEDLAGRFGQPPESGIEVAWLAGHGHEHAARGMGAAGVEVTLLGGQAPNPGTRHYIECLGRGVLTTSDIIDIRKKGIGL